MANINLLPWREAVREEKKNSFYKALVASLLVAGLLLILWNMYVGVQISQEKEKNQLLTTEIAKLNEKVKELDELKAKRDDLIKRVQVIKELQGQRPKIVHVFDQLTNLVPDGVFLTSLNRKLDLMTVKGTAENNNDVSDLMRQLASSPWFAEPVLKQVKANEALGELASDFELTVNISTPSATDVQQLSYSTDTVVEESSSQQAPSESSTAGSVAQNVLNIDVDGASQNLSKDKVEAVDNAVEGGN